jgi:hypothetical protein
MATTDLDKLVTEAHEALSTAITDKSGTYAEWCLRVADAYDALRQAHAVAMRDMDPPARSVLFWALLDAELAARDRAAEMRREAARLDAAAAASQRQ